MAPEADTMILQPQIISLEPEFRTDRSVTGGGNPFPSSWISGKPRLEEASVVKEGQLLFTIDPRSFEADFVARSRLASTGSGSSERDSR